METIDGRAKSLIGEAESRVLEAAKKGLKESLADLPLVSDVFLVDDKNQVVFLGPKPLFLLPGEKQRSREIARSLENDERWKRAEAAEFRLNDQSLAAALYQDLAAKPADPAQDALILNRLARCYMKLGQLEKALAAYRQQLQIGLSDLTSEGIPLEITALYQIGNVLLLRGRKAEAAGAFLELYQGLLDAKWALSRSQFESFGKLAEDRFQTAVGGLDASLRADWDGRLQDLKKTEAERLDKTGLLEKGRERIIPRMRLEARETDADSGRFLRIAEPMDSGLLLASFLPLDTNTMLGLLLDPQALAGGLFPQTSGKPEPEEGWSVAIVDESGKVVVGQGLVSPEVSEESGGPPLVFPGAFAASFLLTPPVARWANGRPSTPPMAGVSGGALSMGAGGRWIQREREMGYR